MSSTKLLVASAVIALIGGNILGGLQGVGIVMIHIALALLLAAIIKSV